ncbi:MAG: AMP-dependent synthetase [Deltaproteobacteria bacterium]|jgi:fatty-acyl-CoA synthase|nr:AMP-dependent synthetase [Deltaproteobacteria bacterium]MDP6076072.1 AMP-binding protein [Myxococcota bacterium]MDP7300736.1 AMP-binding protein [Myxococcota bacterium]
MDVNDSRLTLPRFLDQVSDAFGTRVAIHFAGRNTTYADLREQVRELSRALVGAGVVKGARVAVHMANRPEWLVSAYAAARLGAVVVPVNTFATREELRHILRHGDVSLLLMQPSLLKHAYLDDLLAEEPGIATGESGRLRSTALPQLRRVACLGLDAGRGGVQSWPELLALGCDVPDALVDAVADEVHPSDDGVLVYTSGTTALPKGVLHTQRAAVLQAWRFAEMLRFGPEERVFTTYPFFWTAGIAMSIGGTLAAGGRLLLQESFDPGAALDLIESERATAVHAWPHQHKALGEHPTASSRELSSLRKIDVSSPLAALAGIEKDEYGAGASYGLSETFTIASAIPADSPLELRHSCHGVPLPGMHFRIVDPETGEQLGPDQQGEIAVKGSSFMRGYHKVLPENYLDEDGFFRTQDGGSLDAGGRLHWTGRLGNLIKTGGANVSPVEIERTLEKHSAVKVGIPVGIEHPTLGEVVVLCVVPTAGARVDAEELRGFLRERLAVYKVPRLVLEFSTDELSYTGNEKVQVAPLREAARARLEEAGVEIDGYRYVKREGV